MNRRSITQDVLSYLGSIVTTVHLMAIDHKLFHAQSGMPYGHPACRGCQPVH